MLKKIIVRRSSNIKISKANGVIVELITAMDGKHKGKVGLLYNVSTWNKRTNAYFLNFKDGERVYLNSIKPDTEVRKLDDKEVMSVAPTNPDMILKSVPLRGGVCGADPELFVVDAANVIIPAFKFLGAKPKKVDKLGKGECFWDGFQAEFTPPAGSCLAFFTDAVQASLKQVLKKAREVDPKAKLSWKSVMDIPERFMEEATPDQADLGCAPSLNAYTGVDPIRVDDPTTLFFRFAGCHVHMGIGKQTRESADRVVQTIDAIWGPISVSLFRGMEDPRRRAFYGRAGEYRLPPHGIEYRTPSSAMLSHPAIFHLCFEFIRAATQIGVMHCGAMWKARQKDTVTCINYYDVGKADMILKQNSAVVKGILQRRFNSTTTTERAWKLITDGALSYFGCEDMEKDWKLKSGWCSHSDSSNCCVANIGR